ncbi:MAG: hypothetical protein QXH67_00550 [Candidatus Bathyarchaeia archaeon]
MRKTLLIAAVISAVSLIGVTFGSSILLLSAQSTLPFTVKVLDHNGNPVRGIHVWLEPPWRGGYTDENGLYTIWIQTPQSVKVRITNVKGVYYGPFNHPQSDGGTMVLVRLSNVTWIVTTETGIPVKNAELQIGTSHFFRTDENGKVSVLLPAAGEGTIYTYRIGYASTRGSWINVTVYYCQNLEIKYNDLVAIPVKVVDSTGNPIQGVTISREPGFVSPQNTDANGMVDWKWCPRGGTITLRAKIGEGSSAWTAQWTATIPETGPVPGPIFQKNS